MARSIDEPGCPIVAIVAGAGGVDALQRLLHALTPGLGFAYLLVQPAADGAPADLAALLAGCTALPVRPALPGDRPLADHVHVPPAGQLLALESGRFAALPDGPAAIDRLLAGLAANGPAPALAVILSATGSDGTEGAAQLRQAGGIVLVQEPSCAENAALPRAVIAAGAADYVQPVATLAAQLARCAAIRRETVRPDTVATSLRAFDGILQAVHRVSGMDVDAYKPTPLIRRIRLRMETRRVASLHDYRALLDDDPGEVDVLVGGMPFQVTGFFRDPAAWQALQPAIDALLAEAPHGLRAWVTACSSGEEPYSLAMLLTERAEALDLAADFRVFATDASSQLVARASNGVFARTATRNLSPQRLAGFFYQADERYRVKRSLRERIVFATQDLLLDPPMRDFDLVACRNLLIYLTPQAAQRVIADLTAALRPGGLLFLGQSEKYVVHGELELVCSRSNVYRRVVRAGSAGTETPPPSPAAAATPRTVAGLDDHAPHAGLPDNWSSDARIASDALEASREESLALNQELRFINDELKSANAALQQTIAELDMQRQVLSSGAVMTLYLDRALCVRWFTPAAVELFPLVPMDIGRPIGHLTPRFRDPAFFDDIDAVLGTNQPSEAEVHHRDGRWFMRSVRPHAGDGTAGSGVAVTFTDITRGKLAEAELQESQASLADQNEAFRAAMNDAPLDVALAPLIRTAVAHFGSDVRCAFYLADATGRELFHITGMGEAYRRCVDGFKVGPDSLACGLAVHTGRPVITRDVLEEPGWREWTWLAADFQFRGCWSFPIETATGKVVGTLAVYHPAPRDAGPKDLRLAAMITGGAAIIISRHREMEHGAQVAGAMPAPT